MGKASSTVLKELLSSEACTLEHLDLSANPSLEGTDITAGLKLNRSLTSINLSRIPSANSEKAFEALGTSLLHDENKCRLGLLSCDAFQVSASHRRHRPVAARVCPVRPA